MDFPPGQTVASVSGNSQSFCALFTSGKASCWGAAGPLGNGREAYYPGYYADSMGAKLAFVQVGSGRTIKQLVSLAFTNCALLDNDAIKCWGRWCVAVTLYGLKTRATTTLQFGRGM